MRRTPLLPVWLLSLPCLSGCLYYASPRLDCTPNVQLEAASADVHAFRVDVTREKLVPLPGLVNGSPGDQAGRGEELSGHLADVPVSDTGEVPAQLKLSASYGLAYPLLVVNALRNTGHSLSLTLYRPGYELVEIGSRQKVDKIDWTPVPDLEGQERVLDQLYRGRTGTGGVLLFGASEYERLATAASTRDQRSILVHKARRLRDEVDKMK